MQKEDFDRVENGKKEREFCRKNFEKSLE